LISLNVTIDLPSIWHNVIPKGHSSDEKETYNNSKYMRCSMKSDFGSLVWVNDKEGREYVCTANSDFEKTRDLESLSESERSSCSNVNEFISTDRW